MKVFVATPIREDRVHASYAQSLMMAAQDCARREIELVPKILQNSCFIQLARSVLVKLFLETDCTHLFFIDSDIGFEGHALAGLVEAGVPICAGVYRKREPGGLFNAKVHEPHEMRGPWLRVDKVATGFMCIERGVLERMSKRTTSLYVGGYGEVPMVFDFSTDYPDDDADMPEVKRMIGEDYNFCNRYNNLYDNGVFDQPIWVYPDITLDHDGIVGNLHETLSEDRAIHNPPHGNENGP